MLGLPLRGAYASTAQNTVHGFDIFFEKVPACDSGPGFQGQPIGLGPLRLAHCAYPIGPGPIGLYSLSAANYLLIRRYLHVTCRQLVDNLLLFAATWFLVWRYLPLVLAKTRAP